MRPISYLPIEATLSVICNVGFAGIVNVEDGNPLPEGVILTVDEPDCSLVRVVPVPRNGVGDRHLWRR